MMSQATGGKKRAHLVSMVGTTLQKVLAGKLKMRDIN